MSTSEFILSLTKLATELAWNNGLAVQVYTEHHTVVLRFKVLDLAAEYRYETLELMLNKSWASLIADVCRRVAVESKIKMTADALTARASTERRTRSESISVRQQCGCVMHFTYKEVLDGRWVDVTKDGFVDIRVDLCADCTKAKKIGPGQTVVASAREQT